MAKSDDAGDKNMTANEQPGEKYKPIAASLEALYEEFKRASYTYPPLYHQGLFPSWELDLPTMEIEHWRRFIEANQSSDWQEWHNHDRRLCERFYGNKEGLHEFKQLAESTYLVLCELRDELRPEDGWQGFLTLLYLMAGAYPTPLLRIETGTWGYDPLDPKWKGEDCTSLLRAKWDDKGGFALHPCVESLKHNLFTSSMAAIQMITDRDKSLLVGRDLTQESEVPEIPLPQLSRRTVSEEEVSTQLKPQHYMFKKKNSKWHLQFPGDEPDTFRDEKGFHHYAVILGTTRGEAIECSDIDPPPPNRQKPKNIGRTPTMDDIGLKDLNKQIKDASDRVEALKATGGDFGDAENDYKQLMAQRGKLLNKRGQPRDLAEPPPEEQARHRVKGAMRNCRKKIIETMPHLALYLELMVRPVKGTAYMYVPPTPVDWDL